jgi:hypothetical protein
MSNVINWISLIWTRLQFFKTTFSSFQITSYFSLNHIHYKINAKIQSPLLSQSVGKGWALPDIMPKCHYESICRFWHSSVSSPVFCDHCRIHIMDAETQYHKPQRASDEAVHMRGNSPKQNQHLLVGVHWPSNGISESKLLPVWGQFTISCAKTLNKHIHLLEFQLVLQP